MIFNLWILVLGLGLFLAVDARRLQQPIGIDLGPELLTAAYAHTSDNVSVIAAITPGPDDIYIRHMLLLRLEFADRHDIMRPWRTPEQWSFKGYLSNLSQQWMSELNSFLDKQALQSSQVLSFARTVFRTILEAASYTRRLVNPRYNEGLRLSDVKAGFVDMLRQLKQKAATDSDIDLKYAVIAVPEFFNQTLREMVADASKEVGIKSALTPVSRTNVATFSSTSTIANPPGLNYAVIDHGMFYLDVSAEADGGKSARKRNYQYFPALQFGSTMIDSYITDRLVDREEDLGVEIAIGASKTALYGPVRQARTLIRDDLDSHLLGSKKDEDHHLDEYPLDLTNWGFGQSQAVLPWEDVHAAERRFVEVVASNLISYLKVLRYRRSPDTPLHRIMPERLDQVVILTTGPDGHLLKQAVQEGFGDHIKIIGGTLRESFSLAALGAARGALVAMSPGICRKPSEQHGVFDHEL